ncbi:MAG: heparin lyase I family protein, partial [Planctomycetes bacterium]|nr:heparin lyase I family protein [Planctomycetota bacterium]
MLSRTHMVRRTRVIRIAWITVVLAFCLAVFERYNVLAFVDRHARSVPADGVLFRDAFASGDAWMRGFEPSGRGTIEAGRLDAIEKATTDLEPGPPGILFRLERGIAGEDGHRAEVVPSTCFDHYKGSYARFGHRYRYRFRAFWPEGWKRVKQPHSFVQWHGVPDRLLFERDRNPCVILLVRDGRLVLERRHDHRLRTDVVSPYEIHYDGVSTHDLGPIEDHVGRIVDWSFEFEWSYDERAGWLRVVRDGIE